MKVTVERATVDPVDVCSKAAGTCYGRRNVSRKRLETCYGSGHLSVFEHASATFYVEGISRACMAQITRHRLASFCVESQRYNKYDNDFFGNEDWYVMPPSFKADDNFSYFYFGVMNRHAENYMAAVKSGIKPEDARYLLPEATKTNLVVTMNCRELFHFFDMRRAKSAQWEIRQLADAMAEALAAEGREWAFMVGLWA